MSLLSREHGVIGDQHTAVSPSTERYSPV